MNNFWDEEEINEFVKWILKMVCVWTVSGLCYVTIFYGNSLTAWILGTLIGMKVWDWYKEKQQHEDNGRKTAE